ncbi:MAG: phosphoadenylyl-sulfate reductase [Myxococcales bacterium]|nr:phosphoadenylyl-sulfate reductase [Myxococcales bacterium]
MHLANATATAAEPDLTALDPAPEEATAEQLIAWAHHRYGERLVLSTSFGATSAVMLHLVSRAAPGIPVICIDTGYLFPETYRFAEELRERLGLNLRYYGSPISAARQEALYGRLWEQGDEGVKRYLRMNKVEPMQRALVELGAEAWLAGLRSDQTEHRAGLPRVGMQDGRVKIHPILSWSAADVDAYMDEHDLPYHPLYAKGYRSIGDHHSTLPVTADMDPRAGRMLGKKRECGLHLPLTDEQNKSFKSSGL